MFPEQALANLASVANAALLNAADRTAINQSVQTLYEMVKSQAAVPAAPVVTPPDPS